MLRCASLKYTAIVWCTTPASHTPIREKEDFKTLSDLSHSLKGSSAGLGLQRVQETCAVIERYGKEQTQSHDGDTLTSTEAVKRIRPRLKEVEEENGTAESWIKEWYTNNTSEG